MATKTTNLDILLIQPTDYFADTSFNKIIEDIDKKVVGIAHLLSKGHWSTWEKNKDYVKGDVIRIANSKSNQYYMCITEGTSGAKEPTNNVAGSLVVDGSARWKVCEIGGSGDTTGVQLWLAGQYYSKGDIVLYVNAFYRCIADHTASTTFELDSGKFTTLCAEPRFWKKGIFYRVGDVVVYENNLYVCNDSHTSQADFTLDTVKWDLISSFGLVYEHEINRTYMKGELATIHNRLYRCKVAHTSSNMGFSQDVSNWDLVSAQIPAWTTATYYGVGDIIQSDNVMYKCITAHTSTTDLATDRANWTPFPKSTAYIQDWESKASYEPNQVINYKGKLFRCITANNDTNFTSTNWEKLGGGDLSLWETKTAYALGDTVIYDKKLYRCTVPHTSKDFQKEISNWEEISATRISDWAISTPYVSGDLVIRDKKIYRCTSSHTSDSTFSSTEESQWEYILGGDNNGISQWETATKYKEGNVVLKNNTPYISNTNHTSNTFADDFQKWDLTYSNIRDWESGVFYHKGSIVVHNDAIFQANTPHLSSDFDTDIGAVFQTTEPYGYDYTAISPNLVVVFKEETDLTGFFILQSEKTRTNGASLTTVDVDITDSNNVTKTVKVTVGTKLEVTEKATSIKFKNPVGVNGSVTEYVNQTSLILVYGKDVSCWTSLINPNKITKKQIDALF